MSANLTQHRPIAIVYQCVFLCPLNIRHFLSFSAELLLRLSERLLTISTERGKSMVSLTHDTFNYRRLLIYKRLNHKELSTMHQIMLSQNKIALVDDDDFERFSRSKWFYRAERNNLPGYAIRHLRLGPNDYKTDYLHRAIMTPPPGTEVIFLNHDRLDCRKENLRVVTKEEARQHHRVRKDSQSGVKGVRNIPFTKTWTGEIYRDGRSHSIGMFKSREAAEAAYQKAMREENPDLHSAPPLIERQVEPVSIDPIVEEQAKSIGDA